MRVLVVSVALPFPPLGGGQTRTYHLVQALAAEHDVTLAGFTFGPDPQVAAPFPVRILAIPWEWPPLYQQMNSSDEPIADRATNELERDDGEPWFVSFYDSSRMEATLRLLSGKGTDLILFEGTDMARFLTVFDNRIPIVLDLMDVHSLMARREAERAVGADRAKALREASRTLRFERSAARRCSLCLACSPAEATAARDLLEIDRVEVVANGVDTSYFTPAAVATSDGPVELIFTGTMNYWANAEAVVHFVRHAFPIIRRSVPGAQFHIVGADPAAEVLALAGDGVSVHGRVPDMRPYLARATVVVAPILSGGGTRLKVLEAAASGKAIVSTSLGAEGLEFQPGRDILIADSDQGFADAVLSLVADAGRRHLLGERAREVACRYDWDVIGPRLREAVRAVR